MTVVKEEGISQRGRVGIRRDAMSSEEGCAGFVNYGTFTGVEVSYTVLIGSAKQAVGDHFETNALLVAKTPRCGKGIVEKAEVV
jgi:hypothetical protein